MNKYKYGKIIPDSYPMNLSWELRVFPGKFLPISCHICKYNSKFSIIFSNLDDYLIDHISERHRKII